MTSAACVTGTSRGRSTMILRAVSIWPAASAANGPAAGKAAAHWRNRRRCMEVNDEFIGRSRFACFRRQVGRDGCHHGRGELLASLLSEVNAACVVQPRQFVRVAEGGGQVVHRHFEFLHYAKGDAIVFEDTGVLEPVASGLPIHLRTLVDEWRAER